MFLEVIVDIDAAAASAAAAAAFAAVSRETTVKTVVKPEAAAASVSIITSRNTTLTGEAAEKIPPEKRTPVTAVKIFWRSEIFTESEVFWTYRPLDKSI